MGFPISSIGAFPVRWDSMFESGEGDVECDQATSLSAEDAKRIARIIKQPLKTQPRNTQIFERPVFWSFMRMVSRRRYHKLRPLHRPRSNLGFILISFIEVPINFYNDSAYFPDGRRCIIRH